MKRALLSVSNKEGIIDLAKFLVNQKVEIISTGGTAKLLEENGVKITSITEVTNNPEAFGGRMKSISFQVGSALLYRRDNEQDQKDAKDLGIEAIDLVVCNLYPFIEVSKSTNSRETLIENIDIGGPTMIRAAAKNFKHVSILTNPTQYTGFQENFARIDEEYRYKLAIEAFKMTAEYDQFIFSTFNTEGLPIASTQSEELRYGENPHQKAWVLPLNNAKDKATLKSGNVLQGKALSYNNMVDMDAAWKCTSELHTTFENKNIVTIVKHANPCGVSIGDKNLATTLEEAWACDPVSSFGSIIAFNQEVDLETANWLGDKFVEIIIAPSFHKDALEKFSKKKNLRLMEIPCKAAEAREMTVKSISGALLIQEEDELHRYEYKTVTQNTIPTDLTELKTFGMIVNKYLKSNSIALVGNRNNCYTLAGGGMGQPNRLDSLKMLAGPRAQELGYNLGDVLLISDAFFPFRDSIDTAAEMGIKNILQPGGSIRDEEVITACNEHQIAMEFTATRHFRH